MSGSMTGTRQQAASNFAVSLVDQLRGTGFLNSGAAFYFTDCILPVAVPMSTDISRLRTGLAHVSTAPTDYSCYGGVHTRVYDAIIAGTTDIYAQPPSLTRLYVVLTDGEHSGTPTVPSEVAATLTPGVFTELILIGNPGAPGHAGLQEIASRAGPHVRARATTALNSIVSDIVDRTCTNFRPTASFSISDSELRLGIEGTTITFNGASSSDPDGSIVAYRWRFTRPDGTTFDQNGNPQTVTFDDTQLPRDNWSVRLTVRDNQGAEHDVSRNFRVIGSKPVISINGATQIDALLQPIELSASTTVDPDGGPPLAFRWDILDAPQGASLVKQDNYQGGPSGGPSTIRIPTTDQDIGKWRFRLTARDNEGEEGFAEVEVNVRNLPPKITLSPAGDIEIDAGGSINIANTTPDDPDGGTVTHDWELVQAPVAAGVTPQRRFQVGPTLDVRNAQAGTWIFKLHAIDNDQEDNSEVAQELSVLIDGPAAAVIAGPEHQRAHAALTLDGRQSLDADSPPHTVPNRGHVTSEAGVRGISPGIDTYRWDLAEVPPDQFPRYVTGPVEYSLGVPSGTDTLTISRGLPPGSWTFQLEVVDAELNRDATTHTVLVLEPNTPPVAIANSTGYTLTDVSGVSLGPTAATAADSFDLDNLVSSRYRPGLGIESYAWQYLLAPSGCPSPPAPTSGSGAATFQLYATGTLIPTLCHGSYLLGVTVTDDEGTAALSNFVQVPLSIGNCPGEICIDYPTSSNYQYVEFAERADVTIFYHLNSGLYGNPLFANGTKLEIALFHENDLNTPVYTGQMDYDVLSALYMGYSAANWHGFTNSGTRPRAGKYSIRVRATPPFLPAPYSEALQPNAIWLETLDVDIAPNSDRVLSLNRLAARADSLRIDYSVSAHFTVRPAFDEAWLHIRSTAHPGNVIGSVRIPTPAAGTFNWNGELSRGVQITPGEYTTEVEIKKGGRSLGTSPRNAFIAYRVEVQVDGTAPADKQTPGAVLGVNAAPKNLTVKLEPRSLSGDVTLRTTGDPGATEIKEGAAVLNTDAPAGVSQLANAYTGPKVFTVKMLKGTASPTKFEVLYTPSGNPPGKDAVDFVNLIGLDVGLSPFCSDEVANANGGAFVQRNPTAVVAGNFEELKFVMHPVTVTAQPTLGSSTTEVSLEYEKIGGAAIATLYEDTAGGTLSPLSLPKIWSRSDFDPSTNKLDVKLLANGAGYGEVVLVLKYKADGKVITEKKLKLRVDDSPGIAGKFVLTYPEFLYQRVFSEGSSIAAGLDPSRYAERVGRKAMVYVVRHKSPAEWAKNNTIQSIVPSQEIIFDAKGVGFNLSRLGIIPPNNLVAEKGYDIVYDFGRCPSDPAAFTTDLRLNPGDIVDSIAPDQPSLVVVPNALAPGPYGVSTAEYGMPPTPPSAPVIVADPISQTVAVGNAATFNIMATGSILSYQWQKNGVNIPGATSPTYTTGPLALAGGGDRYRCVVSNLVNGIPGSVSSAEVVLSAPAPLPALGPVIIVEPARQTVTEGRTTATFGITAAGAWLSYQWQKNGVDIPGATSPTYATGFMSMADDGARYRCVVTNGAGAVVSAEGVLNVVPVKTSVPAGYNGLATAFDFRLRGRVAYPNSLPLPLVKVPLVAIAHGNHTPLWVDLGRGWVKVPTTVTTDENYRGHAYLQDFLASYGFASVSVDLDEMTGDWDFPASVLGYPDIDRTTAGILLRANVLLRNIEEVLNNPAVAGGALAGRIDPADIYLLGHSRGGEAVIVATGLLAGTVSKPVGVPPFAPIDVRGAISLAPMAIHTVQPPLVALPASKPFMLLYGSADGDVNGATRPQGWPFAHFDLATSGPAHQIYIRGANHNAWNQSWPDDDAVPNCGGSPTPLNPSRPTDSIQRDAARAYVLAFLQHYRLGQPAYGAYLSLPPALLRPAGLPNDSLLPLMGAFRPAAGPARAVLDDYESNFGPLKLDLSSSGATVSNTLATLSEESLRDTNLSSEAEPYNRFFQATQGAMLGWAAAGGGYAVQLPPGSRDLRSASVALRLALQPPDGTAVLSDIDFSVTLTDAAGNASTVTASTWRRVRGTYPTKMCGVMTTKAAFETFVFPWWAFVANGRTFDLSNVAEARLDFAAPAGRVGVDDLEIWK